MVNNEKETAGFQSQNEASHVNRRRVLQGVAAGGLFAVSPSLAGASDDEEESEDEETNEVGPQQTEGGPVILMGLDSEQAPGSSGHGPPGDHQDMVQSILDSVTNGGSGILVLGDDTSSVVDYWEGDVGTPLGESVTFVADPEDIRDQDFDGFAMIGVPSSEDEIPGGLTNARNQALVDRAQDIADFVRNGGGLLGKTQEELNQPWEYINVLVEDDFNDIVANSNADNSSVQVTQAGLDLGLTQDGMDGWCCYHETFEEYPDRFDELIVNDDESDSGFEQPNAIGGRAVEIDEPSGDCVVDRERSRDDDPEDACEDHRDNHKGKRERERSRDDEDSDRSDGRDRDRSRDDDGGSGSGSGSSGSSSSGRGGSSGR